MSNEIEHIEYDRDVNPYPSFGKKYNSERAIISLTSWKARINTVGKTLFSLIKQCPGFHIVLVLSEEEFPLMEKELPKELMLFVNNNLIEILWVYKNYKAFKKVLFTIDKYRNVPVISADDDCIYTCNYAQMLYDKWLTLKNKNVSIRWSFWKNKLHIPSGPTNLYYGLSNYAMKIINSLDEETIKKSQDDATIGEFFKKINYQCINLVNTSDQKPFKFHDEITPLHEYSKTSGAFKNCYTR